MKILNRSREIDFRIDNLIGRLDTFNIKLENLQCNKVKDVESPKLGFGKYGSLSASEVIAKNPGYARWLSTVDSKDSRFITAQLRFNKLLPEIERPKDGSSCSKFVEWLAVTNPTPIKEYLDEVFKIVPQQKSKEIKLGEITDRTLLGKYVDSKIKGLSTDIKMDIDLESALKFVGKLPHVVFDLQVIIQHNDRKIMTGIADMISDDSIYEIKTGNSAFGAYSWIQVLLYAIGLKLNHVRIYNVISGKVAYYIISAKTISEVETMLYNV